MWKDAVGGSEAKAVWAKSAVDVKAKVKDGEVEKRHARTVAGRLTTRKSGQRASLWQGIVGSASTV